MSRKKNHGSKYVKLLPDDKYNSLLIRRFANMLMKDGKYTKAYSKLCAALEAVVEHRNKGLSAEEKEKAVVELVDLLIEKAGPDVEVKTKRLGGANYLVPIVVKKDRRVTLAFRWLIKFSRKRVGAMQDCLKKEFIDLLEERGGTHNEKLNLHRMAAAHMAFANIK